MAWFVLARLLFVAAVGYSAFQLQPLVGGAASERRSSASSSASLIVALRDPAQGHLRHAPARRALGGAIGLAAAKTIGAALYWANLGDGRVVFLHSVILLALPYLGLVLGGRKGEWLEPENI